MRLAKNTAVLLIVFLLHSCGYRWHYEYPNGVMPTVSIPLIKGDEDAGLTAEIISCLNSSGLIQVVPRSGDYRMIVDIVSRDQDEIGYRRNAQTIKGTASTNLVASEGRSTLRAMVTLYHHHTDEIAFGPYELTSDSDYDYVDGDSYHDLTFISANGGLTEVLPFSLGQLESIESAQEAASSPLYHRLAQKIVDVISAEW